MRFTCEQRSLTTALNIVSRAVSSKTTLPVLKGIMINATKDGKLTLYASDSDISIQNTIVAKVSNSGSVLVMAKLFGDIIRKLPAEELEIETDEKNNVTIRSTNSEFNIIGTSSDEFPIMEEITENTESVVFDRFLLKEMIDKTAFAASNDESRGIITGVLLELQDGDLNMVAIDGYRISITRRPMPEAKTYSIIIHARILGELSRIISEIDDEENSCILYLAEKRAVFSFSDVSAELKLMDGQFIPYKDILPANSKIIIDVNRKQLMESIDRASLLARSGKNNLVKFEISENTITVTSDSEEGTVREDITVNKSGDDLMIGFNAIYLKDVLKAIDEDEIRILFNSSIDPCLVKPFDGNEYEYLVLPVRI